jgi:DNA-binding NtrC family response regulator
MRPVRRAHRQRATGLASDVAGPRVCWPVRGLVPVKTHLLFLAAEAATFAPFLPSLRALEFDLRSGLLPQAERLCGDEPPDLVVLEHANTCAPECFEAAAAVVRLVPGALLILATREGSEDVAVCALRAGFHDYLTLPLSEESLVCAIRSHLQPAERPRRAFSQCHVPGRKEPGPMVANHRSMREIRDYAARAATTDCTVLITGETGTGKELLAEFVHQNSARREKPFVCINCAAIPDDLLENELFGHTKGAFTGAQELRDGLLSAADEGTVFLDEIGDLSPFAQAKILRVLEKKEFCRLGGTRQLHLNLRFIAATNQDLYAMSKERAFRRDLLFRLDVAHLHLPPLRERKEEIPVMVQEFGQQFSRHWARRMPEFTKDSLGMLLRYDWPGNVRELKNVVERLFLMELASPVGPEFLPSLLGQTLARGNDLSPDERELLISTLFSTKWNKTKAAEMLHWSRMTLYRKIAKYHISCDPPIPAEKQAAAAGA